MNRIKSLLVFAVLMMAFTSCTEAKTATDDVTFALEKVNGHYYFNADMNGATAKIMVESGIPALLIGSDFYEQNKQKLNLKVKSGDGKMRLLNKVYNILYIAEARLNVGKAIYDGPVFVLDGADDVRMPVQFLKNPTDNSSVIGIDLPSLSMSVMSRKSMRIEESEYNMFPLSVQKSVNIPVVNAELSMNIGSKQAKMQGDFIVDFGNGSLLFMMKQNENVAKMIADSGIELLDAKDKNGNVVAQGIYADGLSICGIPFTDVSIGVTDKMKTVKEAGFIGLKFFTKPAILDFNKSRMYVAE